jgi:hypothetical protein
VDLVTAALKPNGWNGQPEAIPMACDAMEPALAALGRPAPLFMLGCAGGAAGMKVCGKTDFVFPEWPQPA